MIPPIQDNPVLRRDATLWGKTPGRSFGLVALVVGLSAFAAMSLRRADLGLADAFVPALPYRDAIGEIFRLMVVSPKLLLGLVVAMMCLEELMRGRESGTLDELYLSGMEGREVFTGKVGGLTVRVFRWIALLFALQIADVSALYLFSRAGGGAVAVESLNAFVVAVDLALFVHVTAALAWIAGLLRPDPWRALGLSSLMLAGTILAGLGGNLYLPRLLWAAIDGIGWSAEFDLLLYQTRLGPAAAGLVLVAAQLAAIPFLHRWGGNLFGQKYAGLVRGSV